MRRHALPLHRTTRLKAARVLATRFQPATIEFVWLTGEEAGLLGSREFARRAVRRVGTLPASSGLSKTAV